MVFSGAGASHWPWFQKLRDIVGRRPSATAIEDGVECNHEAAAEEEVLQAYLYLLSVFVFSSCITGILWLPSPSQSIPA